MSMFALKCLVRAEVGLGRHRMFLLPLLGGRPGRSAVLFGPSSGDHT